MCHFRSVRRVGMHAVKLSQRTWDLMLNVQACNREQLTLGTSVSRGNPDFMF